MGTLLPGELLASLNESIRCRELQIQQLACLVASHFPSPPNLVIHGTEASGKTLTINALLRSIDHPSAVIPSRECITTRHLLEQTLIEVQRALGDQEEARQVEIDGRCESISAFAVQLQRLLQYRTKKKFILVFDNIDRQREAAPTLLPALARLHETTPHLTTIFILATPRPSLFQTPGLPHIHFPPYTRSELISLVSASPLPLPSCDPISLSTLWTRFATLTHDTLLRPACTPTLPALVTLCARLWPAFTAPVLSGAYTAQEFPKLLLRNRHLFQSEDALKENIIGCAAAPQLPYLPHATTTKAKNTNNPTGTTRTTTTTSLLHLAPLPAQLLVSAFLASHTPPKHDTLLFSKHSPRGQRRRRNTNIITTAKKTGKRKLTRALLGPQPWTLERMLAIHAAVFLAEEEKYEMRGGRGGRGAGGQGSTLTQFATLVGLRLVVRAAGGGASGGGGDPLAADAKWKVNVDKGVVGPVGRGVGCVVDEWML
ncbi:MAG: hypothetical protein Q9185_002699 [Variospora sp. 1 TL-2023]